MATIKSFTSLEQSKKLAEILPIESADMYYFLDPTPVGNIYIPSLMIIEKHLKSRMPEYDKGDIPCWSLAALLGVLPNENMLVKTTDDEYYCLAKDVMTKHYDNPIDACTDIIIKLKERNII